MNKLLFTIKSIIIFYIITISFNTLANTNYIVSPQNNSNIEKSPELIWKNFAINYSVDISLDNFSSCIYSTYDNGGFVISKTNFKIPQSLWAYLKTRSHLYFRIRSINDQGEILETSEIIKLKVSIAITESDQTNPVVNDFFVSYAESKKLEQIEESEQYIRQELVVELKQEYSTLPEAIYSIAFPIEKQTTALNKKFHRLQLNPDIKMYQAISTIKQMPGIKLVEPNFVYKKQAIITDSGLGNYQWAPQKVKADVAWKNNITGKGVTIAVLETGIRSTHIEFSGTNKLILGPDFGSDDTDSTDEDGHGTHVAGIAAANNNGSGCVGIAPDASILAIKVFNNYGRCSSVDVVQGIHYAIAYGARIINLSINSSGTFADLPDQTNVNDLYINAINDAIQAGIAVVTSAGNDNTTLINYPKGASGAIMVAATRADDTLAPFSNHGPSLSVSAPGYRIYGPKAYIDDEYTFMNGTSTATAVVSGAVALLLQNDPSLTPKEIKTLLEYSADDLGDEGHDPFYGAGRINIARALDLEQGDDTSPASIVSFEATGNNIVVRFSKNLKADSSANSVTLLSNWGQSGMYEFFYTGNPTFSYSSDTMSLTMTNSYAILTPGESVAIFLKTNVTDANSITVLGTYPYTYKSDSKPTYQSFSTVVGSSVNNNVDEYAHVYATDDGHLKILFNQPVTESSAESYTNYTLVVNPIYYGSSQYEFLKSKIQGGLEINLSDKSFDYSPTSRVLTISGLSSGGNFTAGLTFGLELGVGILNADLSNPISSNLKKIYGQIFEAYTTTARVLATDTTMDMSYTSGEIIRVEFSRAMNLDDVQNISNYSITVNGNSLDLSQLSISYDSAYNSAYLVGIDLYSYDDLTYTVYVRNMRTKDGISLPNPSIITGTVLDAAYLPKISHVIAGTNEIKLYFSYYRKIKQSVAEDINNYTLESNIGTNVDLAGFKAYYDWDTNSVSIIKDDRTDFLTAGNSYQISLSNIVAGLGYEHSLSTTNNPYTGYVADQRFNNIVVSQEYYNQSVIACSRNHILILKKDGTVWSFGSNQYGQLGAENIIDRNIAGKVDNLSNIIALAAGSSHSLALKNDGSVWAWGDNSSGQLGDGTTINRSIPAQVDNLSNIIALAAGSSHSLALKNDGSVWAWGHNSSGQLGDGTIIHKSTPVQVNYLSNIIALAASSSHSLALKNDGTVWAWGANYYGQLGDGTKTSKSNPVQITNLSNIISIAGSSGNSLALKKDGTVWGWGHLLHLDTINNSTTPVKIQNLENIKQIAIEYNYLSALKEDKSVWFYKFVSGDKNIPFQHNNFSNIKAITGGFSRNNNLFEDYYLVALEENENLWISGSYSDKMFYNDQGRPDDGIPQKVNNLENIKEISKGGNHFLFLKNDETVWAWGNNYTGQLGDGTIVNKATPVQVQNLENIKQLKAGLAYSIALKRDGTVWAWGCNNLGQLGDGTIIDKDTPVQVQNLENIKDIKVHYNHSFALKENGTVWAWGCNSHGQLGDGTIIDKYTPVQVQNLENIKDIKVNDNYSFALKEDGTVWAWGVNYYGRLGDGTKINRSIPVQVQNLKNIKDIKVNHYCSFGLKEDGTVWSWGENYYGQLGDGTTTNRSIPVKVRNLENIKDIKINYYYLLALKEDGSVWAWGDNYYGQLGDGTRTSRSIPVKVRNLENIKDIKINYYYSLALKEDGTVWAWGKNDVGQLGDGTTIHKSTPVQVHNLESFKDIKTGPNYSLALKEDGTVWAWGDNRYGQLGNGNKGSSSLIPVRCYIDSEVESISVYDNTSIALKKDGTVWVWEKHFSSLNEFIPILNVESLKEPVMNNIYDQVTLEDIETHKAEIEINTLSYSSLDFSYTNTALVSDIAYTCDNTICSFIIYPQKDHSGDCEIITTVTDGFYTDTKKFSLTVIPVNDPPTAKNKNISTSENNSTDIILEASDPDNITLQYTILEPPAHGTYTIKDNICSYTPTMYYEGIDYITYQASDKYLDSEPAKITITINPINNEMLVNNIYSTTHELSSVPEKNYTEIVMRWDLPEGYGKSEISKFVYVFTSQNNGDIQTAIDIMNYTSSQDLDPYHFMGDTFSIIQRISDFVKDNESQCWFHVAAIKTGFPPIYGNVLHSGPYELKMINSKPQFTSYPSFITILEDSITQRIQWADNIWIGPESESDQSISFMITPTNNELFSIQPQVSSDGILTFKPAPNAYGTATFFICLSDGIDKSEKSQLSIDIKPVNDCPVFEKGEDSIINENSGTISIDNWAKNINSGIYEPDQVINFIIETDNDSLFDIKPMISSYGNLTYKTAFKTTGSANVNVKLVDNGGTDLGGCNTSQLKDFIIKVNPLYYTLTINTNSNGEIIVNNEKISVPAQKQYRTDTFINIEAVPLLDYMFSNWSGFILAYSNPLKITVNSNISIIANFKPVPVNLNIDGNGEIKIDNNTTYKLPFSKQFNINTKLNISAIPNENFLRWTGDLIDNNNTIFLTLDRDINLIAHFQEEDDWNYIIHAEAEITEGINNNQNEINIGIAKYNYTEDAFQQSERYSGSIVLNSINMETFRTDIRQKGNINYEWYLSINPHGNVGDLLLPATLTISWEPLINNNDFLCKIMGIDNEVTYVKDMNNTNLFQVSGHNSNYFFRIICSNESFNLYLKKGWNLISLPLNPVNSVISSIFSDLNIAYSYDGEEYEEVTILETGKGYWIYSPIDKHYQIKGTPVKHIKYETEPGWKLHGSSALKSIIKTIPSDCIESVLKYNDGSYVQADFLIPGYGYWLKINENCEIENIDYSP